MKEASAVSFIGNVWVNSEGSIVRQDQNVRITLIAGLIWTTAVTTMPAHALVLTETASVPFSLNIPANGSASGVINLPSFNNSQNTLQTTSATIRYQPVLIGIESNFSQVGIGANIAYVNPNITFNLGVINAGSQTDSPRYLLYCANSSDPCNPFSISQNLILDSVVNSFHGSSFTGMSTVGGSAPITASSAVVNGSGSFSGSLALTGTANVTYGYEALSQSTKNALTALSLGLGITGSAFSFAGSASLLNLVPQTVISAATLDLNILSSVVSTAGTAGALPVGVSGAQSLQLLGLDGVQLAASLLQYSVCPECAAPLALSAIGTSLNALSTGLSLLANDPLDPNYTVFPTQSPQVYSANQLSALGAYANITAQILTAADAARASSFLLVNDMQKYEGAQAAGDAVYLGIIANKYSTDLASFQASIAGLLQGLQVFQMQINSDPSANLTISPSMISSIQSVLAGLGFSADLINQLTADGYLGVLPLSKIESLVFGTDLSSLNLPSVFASLDNLIAAAPSEISAINLSVLPGEVAPSLPVPEPSTVILLILPVLYLCAIRRRNKADTKAL